MSYIREVVSHIPFFYLEIIPFCAILLFAVLSLAVRKKKYVLFLLAFTGSFSCALICLHRNGGVPEALTHAFLFASATLVLSPVFLLRREKKSRNDKKENENLTLPEPTEETKSISFKPVSNVNIVQESVSMSEMKRINGDVQLAHVFQVLKKLESVKLSASDRLETDVIRNMLTIYQSKDMLSVEETHALNNYLATLLKLMSKYSV